MAREHRYLATAVWTGNRGSGTAGYRAYDRAHVIRVAGKSDIAGSSDPAFRGDAGAHNPEDLLVASPPSCHMLWYLHLSAEAGVIVTAYEDTAEGVMLDEGAAGGRFTSVTLRPSVTIAAESDAARAAAIHQEA